VLALHPERADAYSRRALLLSELGRYDEAIPSIDERSYHVFVSYRSTDRDWALSLVARLEGAGLSVFIDQRELVVGQSLARQLQSALQRSRAAVLLVSRGWLESPWCQQEADVLVKRSVEDPSFQLLPLRLDDSPMPALLDSRVWLDFNGRLRAEGEPVERLLNALIARQPPPVDTTSARAETAQRKLTDEFVARVRVAQVGDVAGIEGVRRALSDWLDWMGLIDAGAQARLDRYIGYYKPYATSHDELDQDKNVQEEVRNVARAVANAVRELRAGRLSQPDDELEAPRQK